jgi:heme-degrading monooxygenase HmoA
MYAITRESHLRPGAEEQLRAGREQFAALRAQQPGYQGSMVFDAGDGRIVTIALWDSEEAEVAARTILQPEAARLMTPHLTAPPEVTAHGKVITNELPAR